MKVDIYPGEDGNLVSVVLNGKKYIIKTCNDTYNLADLCQLLHYRSQDHAINRLLRRDVIGTDFQTKNGYVPVFIVRELIKLAPFQYSAKMLRLFEERVFGHVDQTNHHIRRLLHTNLMAQLEDCREKVSILEKELDEARSKLKQAEHDENRYYEKYNLEECYKFNSDYESDYDT